MKNHFLLTITFCLISFSYGQTINITANLENAKDSTVVWISRSIDNNAEHFIQKSDFTSVKNNSFSKSFLQKGTGIVQILPNPFIPNLILICEEGDNIKLNIKNNNKKLEVSYEGSNAEGHELVNNSKIFNKLWLPIYTIIKDANTTKELLDNIDNLKISNLKSFDVLLANKKISKSYYDYCKLFEDTETLSIAYLYLNGYLQSDPNYALGNKLTTDDIKQVITVLDSKYDPFDKKYKNVKTESQIHNIQNKCAFIEQKILTGVENDYGLWDKNNGKEYYSFAPKELQEFLLINEISKSKIDEKTFNQYKKVFPKSIYIKALSKFYKKDNSKKTLSSFTFASLSKDSKKINVLESREFKTLQNLIDTKFNGKAVFIDLWATYCAPCKQEFSYSDDLHNFLINNNIEMLYVSIDNKKMVKRWEQDIYDYQLIGKHYFATNEFQKILNSFLKEDGFSIPRYLLFNTKGELVLKNAKKPSEGQSLYNEILKALN